MISFKRQLNTATFNFQKEALKLVTSGNIRSDSIDYSFRKIGLNDMQLNSLQTAGCRLSHLATSRLSLTSGNIQPAPELVPAVWRLQCSTLTLCCLDNSSCNPTKAWVHTYVTIIQTLTNEQILYLKDWSMTGCCLPKGWFNRLATIYLLIITTKKLKVPTSSSQVTLKFTSSAVHVVGSSVGQMEQSKLWRLTTFSDALNKRSIAWWCFRKSWI